MKNEIKSKISCGITFLCVLTLICLTNNVSRAQNTMRTMKYTSRSEGDAIIWQSDIRSSIFKLLKLDDLMSRREKILLDPKVILSENKGDYELREIEINSTPKRRIRVIVTFPLKAQGPFPAVVCIHGHGGISRIVYDKGSPYKGFAYELAVRNYITIAPFVSQHEVYENGSTLMGERLFDCIRCVDYLESLTEVDKSRIGCAGLSLGGEMAMWLGAMDTRIQATVSAGFLTKMDHMEQNHCKCWKFPGLRELVDYADIYSLTAPRPLMFQNGLKEPPKDFYVPLAREAFGEVQTIYTDLKRPENIHLDVHEGAHVVDIPGLLAFFEKYLANK